MKESNQLNKYDTIRKEVLGKMLSDYRNEMGWTVTELCQIAEIDRDSYLKIERGERNPTLSIVVNVCKALNISLSLLFGSEYVENCLIREKNLEIDNIITIEFCKKLDRKKVIAVLKKLRKQRGMSQAMLSLHTEIPRNVINNFEYGRARVTPELLKSIIKCFDLSLEEFYKLIDMK